MRRTSAAGSDAAPASGIAKRVGVLPFESRSRDTSDAYLGDGMATDLTTALAGMTGLHVVSRSSAFALRGKTAREAGTALTADAMVEGTVGKVEGRLRVTVSLVNVADEAVLWSQRYDVTEKDLYALQDSTATAIVSVLGVGLTRRPDAGLAAHRTANPEAHDLVLRGQFLTDQNSEPGLHQAIALFERAARLDSMYADPWNGIAQAWFFLADTYLAPRAAVPPMREAIEKALALDPTSAWAHALKGSLLSAYLRDYPAAEREYLTAAALDSTAPIVSDYGWLLHGRGLDDSPPGDGAVNLGVNGEAPLGMNEAGYSHEKETRPLFISGGAGGPLGVSSQTDFLRSARLTLSKIRQPQQALPVAAV